MSIEVAPRHHPSSVWPPSPPYLLVILERWRNARWNVSRGNVPADPRVQAMAPILELMVPPLSGNVLLLDLGSHGFDPRLATLFSSYTQMLFPRCPSGTNVTGCARDDVRDPELVSE